VRILHVSTRLILGGSQENTVLSCEGQSRLGHDVHLAFGPIYGPEGSMLERVRAFRAGDRIITTHEVPSMIRALHPLKDWRATRELRALIESIRPDIVHTHSSKAGIIGRAAAWAARRAGMSVGVIHTIHGPPFFPGQNPLIRRVYIESERWAARRCDLIVSVADAMTTQYRAQGIGRQGQFVTVRSGMEVDKFLTPGPAEDRDSMRAALGLAPDHFVIATVARLADQKGHDDLLDALASTLAAPAAANWRLLWVGDGWLRERLIARAQSLGLGVCQFDKGEKLSPQTRIIITGLVPPERVPGFMRAADLLAHPSYREGLPRTVPQALLCGTPAVAYDVDGTREACIDHQTGRLVTLGDRAALAAAIHALAAHAPARLRLAQTGRTMCQQMFSADKMVTDLEAVYARALAASTLSAARAPRSNP